ncbi:hypothetical protein FA13DRAFT_805917 [Coprinellus micaceus]|uniref:Uncharacterized protein n=1 Tax=Coprinellus micaceus TaxID=71717 RepID=A0A4Y7T2I5_COPMI|nr:hypothetical protein FA13DRAFT_805917 [Coprinellus micaceus]
MLWSAPPKANAIASSSTNGKPSKKGKEREKVTIPNLSSANLRRLEALSKRHIALQDVFEEVPDSRSNSERSLAGEEYDADVQKDLEAGLEPKIATNPRIRHLRTKVAAARQDTQDNTAHGKWELVSRLLHLGVTSGGTRWLGARTDGTPPVDIGKEFKARGLGWCNAKTEEEWAEWERRYEEEVALKRRVAEWSKGVEPVAPEEGSSVTAVAVEEPPVKRKQNPLQTTGNALGFSMSKRGTALRANGKPKHIADVTDLSMQPPSFSEAQVITSTQVEKRPAISAEHARQPPSSPPVRRTYGRPSQSPSNLAKSPSVPSFIRPSEPQSPSALRQAASMLPVSPSNAARSRVLVPLNPGRSPRFMSARARSSTSPIASKNNLKRKLPTGSPSQSKDAETYSSFYESVPKRPRLGESQSAKADTNYTSHPDAQNVTQDSLYAPSVPPPTVEPAPYILAGFQFSTPTKETVSQRRESIAESNSLRLPPKEANLPTLTDLLASNKKTKSPKRRKLRTSLIVDTTAPSKTLPGVEPGTPQPISAGMDMNETPTKAPPAADSFGSIPGLTTVPSRRKSPKATEPEPAPAQTNVTGTPLPASIKVNGPEPSENHVNRPHALNFEPPNDGIPVAPGLNNDNVPRLDDDHLEDDPDAAGRHVNSYDGFALNPFAAVGIYEEVDLASPAKSLSSLAGSDSEDTSDEEDEDEVSQNILPTSSLPQSQKEANLVFGALDPANTSFDPQFASTQKEEQEQLKAAVAAPSGTAPIFGISSSNPFLGNLALSQRVSPVRSSQSYGAGLSPSKAHSSSQPSVGWGKYNSQFDVKGRVEEVDKLLGRDLDLEFEPATRKERTEDNDMFKGWLKDVSSDEDGDG